MKELATSSSSGRSYLEEFFQFRFALLPLRGDPRFGLVLVDPLLFFLDFLLLGLVRRGPGIHFGLLQLQEPGVAALAFFAIVSRRHAVLM